jgi:hypothetical protein
MFGMGRYESMQHGTKSNLYSLVHITSARALLHADDARLLQ